jgi:hypothetical protein
MLITSALSAHTLLKRGSKYSWSSTLCPALRIPSFCRNKMLHEISDSHRSEY